MKCIDCKFCELWGDKDGNPYFVCTKKDYPKVITGEVYDYTSCAVKQ